MGILAIRNELQAPLMFVLNSDILCVSRMIRESNTATMPGTYYLPPISKEIHAFSSFMSRYYVDIKGWDSIHLKSFELVIPIVALKSSYAGTPSASK
jgi:hypothetical protein